MTMADDIAAVRRMVVEPTTAVYSDAAVQAVIERYPVIDAAHLSPDNASWTATYDLNAAASDIWAEKAAAVAHQYNFNADGGSYSWQQQYDNYMMSARYFAARRKPRTTRVIGTPAEPQQPWNVSEDGDEPVFGDDLV